MLTNEEKRVTIYADSGEPTVPSQITPDTDVACLNLNWREKDLPEKERTKHVHRLHPYLGKFIPQIVEVFLRKYFLPGQTVCDPFCGSGTTLVQANELGINAVGFDISAFNVLLCKAKTTRYNLSRARREVLDILEKVQRQCGGHSYQLGLFESKEQYLALSPVDFDYLNRWFAPQALSEILTYRQQIDLGGYEYQDLLKVILSRSARSARLTTHFDLDFPKKPQVEPYWCYKHSRMCSPTTDALQFLKRYSLDTLERIEVFSQKRTNASVMVKHADSRVAVMPPITGVITSPPYVGLIDYHEQHAYAYHLLGLEDRREQEIGSAANGNSKKAKSAYQEGMHQVFMNVLNAMPSGGRMVVVAHDKAELYDDIARSIGVRVESIINRHVNRRTGRRATEFYESIFIWQKP